PPLYGPSPLTRNGKFSNGFGGGGAPPGGFASGKMYSKIGAVYSPARRPFGVTITGRSTAASEVLRAISIRTGGRNASSRAERRKRQRPSATALSTATVKGPPMTAPVFGSWSSQRRSLGVPLHAST